MLTIKLGTIEGSIVHFFGLGKHIVVLNSYNAAYDLLFRRSATYSDRPTWPMLGEVYEMFQPYVGTTPLTSFSYPLSRMGGDHGTGFIRYGSEWRAQRRVWQQHLGLRAVGDYATPSREAAREFVTGLLSNDKGMHGQIKL